MRRLLLTSRQSPGDVLMLTAAVRDLHAAAPGEFATDVRTTAQELWNHNPHVTRLDEADKSVERIDMHYPLVHQSNQRPYHFLHGYTQFLEQRLKRSIPVTRFQGDVHLSPEEKSAPFEGALRETPDRFWIVIAGGKFDFTAKWWNPDAFQKVVDHFRGKIAFVQCGEEGHWHPPLRGVTNLVGKTGIRDFLRLMYRAEGVVCPVTFAMHLAAAVESAPGVPRRRPCVVIAGGREPPQWEAYPHHQFISMVGALECCAEGGCWRSRCQLVGDGDSKDRHHLCECPVQVSESLRIPKCMDMIRPEEVIRRIELYYEGGVLGGNGASPPRLSAVPIPSTATASIRETSHRARAKPAPTVRLGFPHDLDALLQFRIVLRHLKHYFPDSRIELQVRAGLSSFVQGLCDAVEELPTRSGIFGTFRFIPWKRCQTEQLAWASTPAMYCVTEEFRLAPIRDLSRYDIELEPSFRDDVSPFENVMRIADADNGTSRPVVLLDVERLLGAENGLLSSAFWTRLGKGIAEQGGVPLWLRFHESGVDVSEDSFPMARRPGQTVGVLQLARCIRQAALVVGPPGLSTRFAAALAVPALCISAEHHPLWTFDPSVSVHHAVAGPILDEVQHETSKRFFKVTYRSQRFSNFEELEQIVMGQLLRHEKKRPKLSPLRTTSTPKVLPQPLSHTSVRFHHGLGDCAHFAHLIPLYLRQGHAIEVESTADKRILFEAAGATVAEVPAEKVHPWGYPSGSTHVGHGQFGQGSKIGHNISEPPLPDIGAKELLWDELCESRVDIRPFLSAESQATVRRWLERMPRPVVLFHQKGNTAQARKSLSDPVTRDFYHAFIDRCDGTLLLLDWDQRVPRLASHRVRHLSDLGSCPLETLLALMTQADLMIGVDSGPLHLTRFTDIPTIGLWQPGHYPTTYTIPRPEQLNLVLAKVTREWNRFKRIPWNLVENAGGEFTGAELAEWTAKMLAAPRYLRAAQDRGHPLGLGPTLAQDVQLQQFVREYCRSTGTSGLASHWDRQRSLDVLFREAAGRFAAPQIVETGTIRAEEDFAGAGFFTYLAGAFVFRHGGRLDSVDLSSRSVQFAREWTRIFGHRVTVHERDSVQFLKEFASPIDVLYLDSLDTTEPGHAAHCQRELEAAWTRLHDQSLVVIDDTPWQAGAWIGKGTTAVPWLLERGWRILYAGYQAVLAKDH